MNDYRVHVYNRPTNTFDNVYVLAASTGLAPSALRRRLDWSPLSLLCSRLILYFRLGLALFTLLAGWGSLDCGDCWLEPASLFWREKDLKLS